MTTILYEHPVFLEHQVPPGHPERPDRLRALNALLEHENFRKLERREAPTANEDAVTLAHPESFLFEVIRMMPEEGMRQIEADTHASPESLKAALTGIGGAMAGVDDVFTGKADNVFVASRPPGHHAEHDKVMGFCLFNTVAIAARHAQKVHGAERVAIIDFDVHHGNGTQDIFQADPSVLYCSTHQMPLYPGTGAKGETGVGNIVNAPLASTRTTATPSPRSTWSATISTGLPASSWMWRANMLATGSSAYWRAAMIWKGWPSRRACISAG
jgi:acetoin utilization deacetylase AcuC-like enzyme